MSDKELTPWGRADPDGTVYVREGDTERVVGQYPDATPEEALAYYERKYQDLHGQVVLLEQRLRGGKSARDLGKAVSALRESVTGANAVGDLASLGARLDRLAKTVGETREKESAKEQEALNQAIAEREKIVHDIETLAGQDLAKVQWKNMGGELDSLFGRWQRTLKENPRVPKNISDTLWKRFRDARGTIETARRKFFAELDEAHRAARVRKELLLKQAEELSTKGAAGIPEYRRLLDEWKRVGNAGRKVDDKLWGKLNAVGDALYGAKADEESKENTVLTENLEKKLALLDEAKPLLDATDRVAARKKLSDIQRRWDDIGKVPHAKLREVEDRLRRIETAVKKLEEDHWKRTDPEKQARFQGFQDQLTQAIENAEATLVSAQEGGDPVLIAKAEEALAAQRAWLNALD